MLKKNLVFIIITILILFGWYKTTADTLGCCDMFPTYGFPLFFYIPEGDMMGKHFNGFFSQIYLILDVLFLLFIPFIVQKIWNFMSKKRSEKK